MRKLKLLLLVVLAGPGFLSFINGIPEPSIGLGIGDKVPELRTTLLNGSDFDLKSLQGKMVLIDFWASFDGESRVDNHQKMMLQKKFANSKFYNGEGFVVVSISLDRFKSPLAKAIKEDGLINALHICDYQGAESSIAKSFEVKEPVNYLIDGDGRLVARGSSINKVAESLEYLHRN
ncbi:TlpA disulfide reductase family protein [Saccharicrinis fermentans]|uniref:Thiol-disulfide oxidoreductase n=1 Tax=Saccharicrinis fermentans DSM 9555 = JCM 21142 TaxID=869213 RepID=W7YCF5_9BACT|nr:TlpA disulfide reductase family protein [Saccharicrinis fermentans]GAF05153.1 thiol-disulfide oxidoreductase [Saccharicrinis fermentans DSM 9555 = JCM 21142]